mmetsp:Transcript_104021/g.238164  ORF Transcript_104021/g.238164 Transcript_104021/m.238164 type:complete len:695 (+) Transcript_104021:53-2137(+)
MRVTLGVWCAASGLAVIETDPSSAGPSAEQCLQPANDIVRENCMEGSPPTEWDINGAGSADLQGFATKISASPGEAVQFKVKTSSKKFRFDIYRLGYYQGLGARKVATVLPENIEAQPDCRWEQETLLVDCGNWHTTARWEVPEGTVSGLFVARVVQEDARKGWRVDASEIEPSFKFRNRQWDYSKMPPCGDEHSCPGLEHSYGAQRVLAGTAMRNSIQEPHASHIFFVVRRDGRPSDVLFQTMDTTWHAYNNYGAPSTYGVWALPRHKAVVQNATDRRAYKRSYNVPVITRDTRAVNMPLHAEYPAIRWLEANGYDVQYWSSVDAHVRGAEIKARARVYLSVGHDEYWSGEQRTAIEQARDDGVHLQFWSGNEAYWKVRWEASLDGEATRTMVVYKESQESTKIDPDKDTWTGTFRDSRPINPQGPRPENALTGTLFTVNAWRNDPLLVPAEYSQLRFWRDTEVAQLQAGQTAVLTKGLLGHEWDEDLDNGFRPEGLIRLSETTVDNVQVIVDAGGCFDSGSATHHLVLYRAPSGAIVFGAGTVQWSWGLDAFHDSVTGVPNLFENEYDTRVGRELQGPDKVVQQVTVNLFADQGVQPATLQSNLRRARGSSDTQPPVVTSSSVQEGVLRATAEDAHGVVAGMEWTANERWHPMVKTTTGWTVDNVPDAVRVRAVDDSLNIGQPVSVTSHGEL